MNMTQNLTVTHVKAECEHGTKLTVTHVKAECEHDTKSNCNSCKG